MIKLFALLLSLFMYTTVYSLDDFDLYRYGVDETITVKRTSFIVKFVLYDTEEELNDVYYRDQERKAGEGVRAFTYSTEDEDVCYVHIKLAELWDDRESMTIMGHEIYHCALARHNNTPNIAAEDLALLK